MRVKSFSPIMNALQPQIACQVIELVIVLGNTMVKVQNLVDTFT